MRLPTQSELEALEEEVIQTHQSCQLTGFCTHLEPLQALMRMLRDSCLFQAPLDALATRAGMIKNMEDTERELLYFCTVTFFAGMQLGVKMAEHDMLEKICEDRSHS